MKLPSYRRLFKQDYAPEEQTLVDKLSNSLNYGIEVIYDALNGKVSLLDNIAANVKDVQLEVTSAGIPKSRTSFAITTSGLLGLQVIKADNLTSSTVYPTGAIFITYSLNGSEVIINHITGLQANNKYLLKVIAWGA